MKKKWKVNKFWMVYGIGCGSPTKPHETKRSAREEAARLALKNPGTSFIVLAAVDAYKADLPVVSRAEVQESRDGENLPGSGSTATIRRGPPDYSPF